MVAVSNETGELASVAEAFGEVAALARRLAAEPDPAILEAARLIAACVLRGGRLLACGNGGSAADAQHFVAELVGRMGVERRPLAAIALSSDPSVVTALGNDYGFERLFSRQVAGLGRPGDVLLAISTSGRSANIVAAIASAQAHGLKSIALVGDGGDPLLDSCDCCIRVAASNAQRIQEIHMVILHIIGAYIERELARERTGFAVNGESGI